jgi:hypothetical protein
MQYLAPSIHFAQRSNDQRSKRRSEQVDGQRHDGLCSTHVQFVRNGAECWRHDCTDHDAVEARCGQHVCDGPFAAARPVFGIIDVEMGVKGYQEGVGGFGC